MDLLSEIKEDLERAQQALQSAERNFQEKDVLTAANRLFVACESAIYALLKLKYGTVSISREGTRPKMALGLAGKKVCILGKGNIGSQVGKICKALGMRTSYFQRGDDLLTATKDAEVIIDCLGANSSTQGILNTKFFNSLKRGSYFITVTGSKIYDVDALLDALDKGILAGAASDAANITPGNTRDPFYQKLLRHPKILVTPHIAFNSDVERRNGNKMMIDNIKAWLKGKPVNIVT